MTKRILNNLKNEDVLQVVFGDEYEYYKSKYTTKTKQVNINRLAEEAAGKLLYNFIIDSENDYSNIDSLLERLWENARQKYSSIDIDAVEAAIRESAVGLKDLAELALSDNFKS